MRIINVIYGSLGSRLTVEVLGREWVLGDVLCEWQLGWHLYHIKLHSATLEENNSGFRACI